MAVKGLNETLLALDKAEFTVQEDVKYIIATYTEKIYREARSILISGGGNTFLTTYGWETFSENLDQFLDFKFEQQGYLGIIEIPEQASKLAIYIEFSTGRSAANYVPTLPPELQIVALKYFINGKGSLIGRPFLIPAFFNNKDKVLYALRDKLKEHGIFSVVVN